MNIHVCENIRYKLLSLEELIINLDRLSRFKLPFDSYYKVFCSILLKCLIYPKYSKNELEKLSLTQISDYTELIWNTSVKKLFPDAKENEESGKILKLLSEIPFYTNDNNTQILINTKLLISPILKNIDENTAPQNLNLLIKANNEFNKSNKVTKEKLISFSNKNNLKYPIQKLIIVEGITEEILLPVFADKLKHNFNKEGIYVLGAGGKTKSPVLYLKLKSNLKIPVVILFDKDAKEVSNLLEKNLLKKDKIVIINKGEFEDILSLNLIKRTLNNEYDTIEPVLIKDLHLFDRMCLNIENYYRTRNLGEFKKAKLSKLIAKNIRYKTDVTDEINDIINIITCKI